MNNYLGIIFDLDGTLIDSSEGIINSVEEALIELQYPPMNRKYIESIIGPPIGDSLKTLMDWNDDEKNIFNTTFRRIYSGKHLLEVSIYPDTIQTLRCFKNKGIRLGIATNKREDYAIELLKEIKLYHLFDIIRCRDLDECLSKKDLIEQCVDDLNLVPCKTVMVGDTKSDWDAAKSLGIDFIAITHGYGFKTDSLLPPQSVSGMNELKNYITSLRYPS